VVTDSIFEDERNFVGRGTTQLAPPGRARTLIDRTVEDVIQGQPAGPSFAVCFAPHPGIAAASFHHELTQSVVNGWSDQAGGLRLRVEPLEPYDRGLWDSPGVDHDWPSEHEYWDWVELTVEHEDVAQSLLSILEADFVSSTHVYPITSIIVDGGRPTEVGLRGYPALATIIGAGASNQRQPALLRVLYGETVRGVERPQ
jgi:hypothetical protein